jgi:hypothetical protein
MNKGALPLNKLLGIKPKKPKKDFASSYKEAKDACKR